MLSLIDEAVAQGARQHKACEILEISERTVQNWRKLEGGEDQRRGPHTPASNALSEQERDHIVARMTSPEFRDLAPAQAVAQMADQGEYIGSESTIYRVLRAHKLDAHRGPTKPRQARPKPQLHAHARDQVWVWDITYLKANVRGQFYYLYLMEDLYSRKIVGWQVHPEETMALSSKLLQDTLLDCGVEPSQLSLHSDNGSPMKGSTMLATMQRLGVASSFSRPGVSNDNAFCESVFRTLKYRAWYPRRGFKDLEQARDWVRGFVSWYNEEHRHSGIGYVTPQERYEGVDRELLSKRNELWEAQREKHPERWGSRPARHWGRPESVSLLPESQS